VVCIVVRYFGGVKLGAGGLIRAYGGAARLVLRESPVEVLIPMKSLRVKMDSSFVGSLYELIGKFAGSTSGEVYHADGSFEMTVTLESKSMDDFGTSLKDATRGQAIVGDDVKITNG
jgi:putative IMPACT (imprinted ancient) family translation regulator